MSGPSYVASNHIQLNYPSYALSHIHYLCVYRCDHVPQTEGFDSTNCHRFCNADRDAKVAACNRNESVIVGGIDVCPQNQYGTQTAALNIAQLNFLQRCQNECVSPQKDETICKYGCDLTIEKIQQQCKKGTIPEDKKSFC
ncbi:hypothetical protein L0F63_004774 [Massospora cicadina]|nr:hypothetical protein L0F63_004774 [Massospora cicadina]